MITENTRRTILFVTTHNLATNPRIVKEIRLALSHQFKVKLLAFSFDGWSKPLNKQLLAELESQMEYHEISATRSPFIPWLQSTLAFMYSKFILLFAKNNFNALSTKANKRAYLIQKYLTKNKLDADLIVAHNPGSFYPACCYAKQHGISLGIDLEDFHEGETNDKSIQEEVKKLVDFILPKSAYISAASPLILKHSIENIMLKNIPSFVVENYFDAAEFMAPINIDGEKLKLVWFSQHINYGRGLDKIIPIIKNHKDKFELHIYGNAHEHFVQQELEGVTNVKVYPAMIQKDLHQKLSEYDLGLALEEKSANANKNYALSNKILAYTQAGLYILASDTDAQKIFISNNPEAGVVTSFDVEELEVTFLKCFSDALNIRATKAKRYAAANSKNWQTESASIIAQWNRLTENQHLV